eukprot:1181982-Prorocentrum_minimum.AAC.1
MVRPGSALVTVPPQELLKLPAGALEAALPPDSSCEEVEVEADLPWLNHFVAEAIADGAACYVPPEDRQSGDGASNAPHFERAAGKAEASGGLKYQVREIRLINITSFYGSSCANNPVAMMHSTPQTQRREI